MNVKNWWPRNQLAVASVANGGAAQSTVGLPRAEFRWGTLAAELAEQVKGCAQELPGS